MCGRAAPGHQLALKSVFDGMKPLHEEVLHVWEADVPVCTEHARSLVRSRRVGKLLYPPLFDFSPWNDSLVFEFRSRAYAELFARLNEAEVR